MFWKKWFPAKQAEPKRSVIDSIIRRYLELDTNSMRAVFSSDMSIRRLHVPYSTIDEYTQHLQQVIQTFEANKVLYPAMMSFDNKPTYLRDFFTTKTRLTLEPCQATAEFVEHACRFLTLYQEKELLTDRSFTVDKNISLTKHIVGNLHQILDELLMSYEN